MSFHLDLRRLAHGEPEGLESETGQLPSHSDRRIHDAPWTCHVWFISRVHYHVYFIQSPYQISSSNKMDGLISDG